MSQVVSQNLPDWRNPKAKLSTMVRCALWLVQEVGEGNAFTREQLREAFPGIAQVDRRLRDLRDYGWIIYTSRDDPTLEPTDQRFVEQGIPVWDPAARRSRTAVTADVRRAILERDGFACRRCGRSVREGATESVGLSIAHLAPLARGGNDTPGNLIVLCSSCHRAVDLQGGVLSTPDPKELAAQVTSLPLREQAQLLAWMTMGQRPLTTTEEIWARYQMLPKSTQEQVTKQLAQLISERTQTEDGEF